MKDLLASFTEFKAKSCKGVFTGICPWCITQTRFIYFMGQTEECEICYRYVYIDENLKIHKNKTFEYNKVIAEILAKDVYSYLKKHEKSLYTPKLLHEKKSEFDSGEMFSNYYSKEKILSDLKDSGEIVHNLKLKPSNKFDLIGYGFRYFKSV